MAPPLVLKQVVVGMACASYWRGAWYVLDDHLFPENTFQSGVASLGLGTAGLAISQGGVADAAAARTLPKFRRFAGLYCLSTSCVLVWRGAWLLCDVLYEEAASKYSKTASAAAATIPSSASTDLEAPIIHATDPHHRTVSGVLSHVFAMVGLLCLGRFASVLAPPAKASIIKDAPLKLLYPKLHSDYTRKALRLFQK